MFINKKALSIMIPAAAAAAILFLCLFLCPGRVSAAVSSGGKVYLENIDVTGMTREEVQAVIDERMEKYGSDLIEIYVEDTLVAVPASEMGLYYANEDLAQTIASMGLNGNVLARYKMDKYIEENGAVIFSLDLRFDGGIVYNVVSETVTGLNRAPVNMKLGKNSDGTFYTIPKINGYHVLVDETTAGLTEYLCTAWHGGVGGYQAFTEIDEAEGALGDDVAQMTSVLGIGSTQYDYWGKYASRAANIANAVSKIDGTVVYPGETFSTEALLVPFTVENGYQYAAGFENGDVVDTIGGGICQVSSTLYRAVLEAELEVVERYQHSMMVGYVDPSMDATIAEGSLDFKFVNTLDAPIYIEGTAQDGTVTFTIYGHETRDPNRSIAFVSEEFDKQESDMQLGLSDDLEYGTYDYQDGHDGLSARAYKIIYQNGEEVSREHISSSYYVRSDGHLIIGTRNAPAEVLPYMEAAVASKNIGEMYILSGYDVEGNRDGDVYSPQDAIALIDYVNGGGTGNPSAAGSDEQAAQAGGEGEQQASGEGEQAAAEGEQQAAAEGEQQAAAEGE